MPCCPAASPPVAAVRDGAIFGGKTAPADAAAIMPPPPCRLAASMSHTGRELSSDCRAGDRGAPSSAPAPLLGTMRTDGRAPSRVLARTPDAVAWLLPTTLHRAASAAAAAQCRRRQRCARQAAWMVTAAQWGMRSSFQAKSNSSVTVGATPSGALPRMTLQRLGLCE
jgi:hypothetical protein